MNPCVDAQASERRASYISLLSGSGIVFIGLAIHLLLATATEVLAARYLGPVSYGLISWGVMVLNIGAILSGLGLNTAARRFVPIFVQSGDSASLRGTLILITSLTGSGAVVEFVLLLVLASTLSLTVFQDVRELPVLTVFAFALPFWSLQKVLLGIAAGFKYPRMKALIEDLFVPAGLLLVVALAATFRFREVGIAVGYAAVYLLSAIVLGGVIARTTAPAWTAPVRPRFRFRETWNFSWPLIFTEPLVKCTGLIDILIVGSLASARDVGTYRVASDLAVIISFILTTFSFMYLPTVSGFLANQDRTHWGEMNARVAHWSMLLSFPVFAVFFFFPAEIIQMVYGPQYAAAAPVLRLLAVAYFGHTMVGFTAVNLVAAGKTRAQLVILWTSLALNIGACYVLIPRVGVVGAALASLLSLWSLNALALLVMWRALRIQPFSKRYFVNLVVLSAIAYAASSLLHAATRLPALLSLALFTIVCLGSMVMLYRSGRLIDAADRDLLRATLERLPFRRPL